MRHSEFQVMKGNDGQFYFHLYATNAENILDSEGYTTKSACLNGIESVKLNSQDDDRFSLEVASNGQFYFVLNAKNGEIIGKSEMYTSEGARNNGVQSVRTYAPEAKTKVIN